MYLLVGNIKNNVRRRRCQRWCVSLRKAPSSVKFTGVHSVLSLSELVSDLKGGRRQGSEDPAAVSASAGQLRPYEKWMENELDIPLALVGLDNGLVPQGKFMMCN